MSQPVAMVGGNVHILICQRGDRSHFQIGQWAMTLAGEPITRDPGRIFDPLVTSA